MAKLAGIPADVLDEARAQLHLLENGEHPHAIKAPAMAAANPTPQASSATQETAAGSPLQSGLFDALPNPALDALKKINPDNLSPREALEQLYRLKELYAKGK